MAALGFVPCLYLQLSESPSSSFGNAAWAGSTLFGFIHTGNSGETWIGILAAGVIGLVFCVSVRLTGSAWWAIGCHASWDWAQSFIYGVADSGTMVQHHLLATHPVGKPILSGGATGPEGSLFILAILFLITLIILFTLPRTSHTNTQALAPQSHPLQA